MGARFGLNVRCVISDGTQPVGRAVGPALEMMDVLSVLRREADAPADLRERALRLAAAVISIGKDSSPFEAYELACRTLNSGAAYKKFERICLAQGGFREPMVAGLQQTIAAPRAGRVSMINNRAIAQLAKLAGAPDMPAAGLRLHVRSGDHVEQGQPLITLYADTAAELTYPLAYADATPDMIQLES